MLISKSRLAPVAVFALLCCKNEKPMDVAPDPLVMHIDSTAKATDDFFMFANGKWFKENPIPASESSNGIFRAVNDTVNAQIRQICVRAAASVNEPGSNKQKIGDFYFSGMDTVTIEREGLNGLKEELAQIDAIKNSSDIMKMVARLHIISGAPMFGFYLGQDARNSDKNAIHFYQGGLGLPDRDYYFDTDERTVNIRKKYTPFIADLSKILGNTEAAAVNSAKAIFDLETRLAKASRKIEALRDDEKNYNKMSIDQLQKKYPAIDFKTFFITAGLPQADTVIVGQPEFLAQLNTEIKQTHLSVWKDYLKYNLVNSLTAYLDDKTYMTDFNFYGALMRGAKAPRKRWKRVVDQTNRALGDLVGQIYVEEYLPKGTKEKLVEIGEAIKQVFAERIKQLDWMSAATKEKALVKLNAMNFKVGYPDKWKDMSSITISRSSYVKNMISANEWGWKQMVSKFGKPVDRTEWHMQPQTYNAYYSPSNNEIVVPACNIIVPGYERTLADDAILYSVIGGSTFGHEITHGFDDQGSKYNEKGNLKNWWTKEDSMKFYSKTKAVVRQYNAYSVEDNLHVRGDATQGENIADLGGVAMGFEAFKKTNQYKQNQIIGGYNPTQRYFLGWAQAWMVNNRPESVANLIKTDVHAPEKFRVIGPLANMPEFYEAFGVKQGDAMYRADSARIKIW